MDFSVSDSNATLYFALIFGLIIAAYGAVLSIMGSLDYFYLSRSRFSILRTIAISSIFFACVLTLIGLISLTYNHLSNLWYSIGMPGLLGLVVFPSLYFVIMKKKMMMRHRLY